MSLLERIGLAPKTGRYSRRAGLVSDARSSQTVGRTLTGRAIAERLGLLAALTLIAMLAFPNVSVYDGSGRVGDVWKKEDVEAPFDYAILRPEAEIQALQDSARQTVPPVFVVRSQAVAQTRARLDSIDARLDSVFVAYIDWQSDALQLDQARARVRAGLPVSVDVDALRRSIREDSARYESRRGDLTLPLSDRQWRYLLRSAFNTATAREPGPSLADRVLGEASRIADDVLDTQNGVGVLDVPSDSVQTRTLLALNLDPAVRSEDELLRSNVVGSEEVGTVARRRLFEAFPGRADTVAIGGVFFEAALEPSLTYDAEGTAQAREDRIQSVLPTRGRVQEGQTIIRRGDEVTPERHEQLRSLVIAQRERSGGTSWARTVLGRLILVLAALTLFFLYVYLLRPSIFYDTRRLILVCLLLGVILTGYLIAGALGGATGGATGYFVPVALASILLTIVFDSRVGSFATMTLAAVGGLVFGYDFQFAFATLIVGVLAVFSVRDVKNRSQIWASAALVAAAYALLLSGYALLRADPLTPRFGQELIGIAVNATLVLFTTPLLWGIERTFAVTTDMTLLELSDTNRTLLKELSLRAPGTFNHSLQVANLAEAAADAIGANALRTRVGALYHDIGKMLKPEYFIENQQPGDNPHERLKPSMSALVIAAHVKEGAQLGREQALPRVVLDFITTHHGTSLIEFFYRKAQEIDGEDAVDEADYRYPGPLPRTNEQAIVMLADSVEAASRSLDKPTPRRLESLIDGIVTSRVADGQLSESALTFADLTRIKETFHALLCGIYHFRVKYPDQDPAASGDGLPEEAAPDEEIDGSRPTSEERSTLG